MKKTFMSGNCDHKDGSRRLYRGAVEAARRLEDHMQNIFTVNDLINSEVTTIRARLKDYCERLMFTDPVEYGRKAEELMWRKVYYDVIQNIKQHKKKAQGSQEADSALQIHLLSGIGNYHHLLLRLQTEFQLNLEDKIEIPFIWHQRGTKKDRWKKYQRSVDLEENVKEWVHQACHRFLICLGDLARYMSEMGQNNSCHAAKRYYYQAFNLEPTMGMPHNQLGTLASMCNYGLDAVYHYMRCMLCSHSFDGAEGNLQRVFEKNNQTFNEPMKERKNDSSIKVKRFICNFLVMCEQCFLLHNELAPSLYQDTLFDLDKCMGFLYTDEKRLLDVNIAETTNTTIFHFNDLIFKVTVMSIMCMARLQQKNKSAISNSIAFTLALFSNIVLCSIKRLNEMFLSNEVANDLDESEVVNGVTNCTDETTPTASPSPPIINFSTNLSIDSHNITRKNKEKRIKSNDRSLSCLRMLRRRRKTSGTSQEDSEFSDDSDEEKALPSDHITSDISETGSISSESLTELEVADDDLVINCTNTSSGDCSVTPNGDISFGSGGDIFNNNGELKPNHVTRNWLTGKKKSNGKIVNNIKNNMHSKMDSTFERNKENFQKQIDSQKDVQRRLSVSCTVTLSPVTTLNDLNRDGLLSCIKIIFDWMQTQTEILSKCDDRSKFIWAQVIELLNFLIKIETSIISSNEYDNLDLEHLKRTHDWEQKYPLPEDIELQNLPLLEKVHEKLHFDKKRILSVRQQSFLRLQCLLNFGSILVKCCNKLVTFDPENKWYSIVSPSNGTICTNGTELVNKQEMDNKELENQREQMMRSMAHLWLRAEVSDLEVLVESSSSPQISPYLVPDTGSLCSYLPLLKQLVGTKRFILVVPSVVIQNLDQIKRDSAGAREATRWLESELRRGSRYMRAQNIQERMSLSLVKYPKKKEKDAWDFFKILECCHYLNQQGSKNNSGGPMVTLITGGSNMLPSNAPAIALSVGVNMENTEEFISKWRNSSKSQG